MAEALLKVFAACAVVIVSCAGVPGTGVELTICSKPGRLYLTLENVEVRLGGLYA